MHRNCNEKIGDFKFRKVQVRLKMLYLVNKIGGAKNDEIINY